MVIKSCPACGARLASPLVCEACHELLEPGTDSPFELFGLAPGLEIDERALRKRLLALSRELHPDFHGAASEELRARAEANTAALNAAHALLATFERRAEWLVAHLGGPSERDERQMPQEFLMDVLEWNTAVEEARHAEPGSEERAALGPLRAHLEEAREDRRAALGRLLVPLPDAGSPDLTRARRQLNALRYVARTLHEIDTLELAFQKSTP